MNRKNLLFIKLFLFFLIFLVFWLKGSFFLDPDFGWHIALGEYIQKYGIPYTDPFSYTMSDYPFVDHEWLTNIFLSKIYPLLKMSGLSILYTLLVFFTIYLSINTTFPNQKVKIDKEKQVKYFNPFKFFIFFLALGVLLPFFGVRPQVQSWLLLAIILKFVSDLKIWKRAKFILPLIILVWVNLHGSFAIGIFTLFLVLFLRFFRKGKIEKEDLYVFGMCLLATFINPYKHRAWWEVFMQATDTKLRFSISEWVSPLFTFDIFFIFLIALSLSSFWLYRKKFYLEGKVLFLFFLALGLSSSRHLPLFLVFSIPLILSAIKFFIFDLTRIPEGLNRLSKAGYFLLLLLSAMFCLQTLNNLKIARDFSEESFYPKNAASFLKENIPQGNIFSEYGWGGYLIWKYPEKKVFIDGRMPSWRWQPTNPKNLAGAFDTYLDILSGKKDYNVIFDQFNIDTVLLRKKTSYKKNKIYFLVSNLLRRFGKEYESYDFLKTLERDGFIKVYEDSISLIYKKA